MQNGLMGRYQPAITAIVLSRHGYVKTEQVDNTHKVVTPIMGLEDTNAILGNDGNQEG